MIVLTGGNGFIGTNLVARWNQRGRRDLMVVDDFPGLRGSGPGVEQPENLRYPEHFSSMLFLDMEELPGWLDDQGYCCQGIVHLGGISDTAASDRERIMRQNFEYTQSLWNWCVRAGRPFIYASSAGTYGDGSLGYDDRGDPRVFQPLSLYAESKHRFDLWALDQNETPPRWAGVKYFNVYGPYENHKGHMASVVFHAFQQMQQTGKVQLFQSHREGISDGGQKRDFVYVADVVEATLHLLRTPVTEQAPNGLYNVGTGTARTFEDLAKAVFTALGRAPDIEYIPMPEHLRDQYQYFTEARIEKLLASGFRRPFLTLEEGVRQYVTGWLQTSTKAA